jgi:hypothetical protein
MIRPDEASKQSCAESVARNGDMNYYQYHPIYIQGSSYFVSKSVFNTAQNERTIRSLTGVRLAFVINGKLSQFSFLNLLQTLMISYILITILNFVMDFVVMYVMPGKSLYKRVKVEKTQNFNELRKQLVMEENMKKKIESITKVARYSDKNKVEELLDSMKVRFTFSSLPCFSPILQIRNTIN